MIFITFIPVLLFINNVNSGVILDKNVKREVSRTRGSYKYNHPPSAIFFSVPVSVVYDDGSRKEKSVQKNVSTTPGTITRSSTESKKITTTTNKPSTTPDSDDFVKTTLSDYLDSTTKGKEENNSILKQEIEAEAAQTTPKINDDQDIPALKISTKAALIKSTSEANEPLENKSSTEKTPSDNTLNINTKDTVSNTTADDNAMITNINDNESSKVRIYMPRDGLIIPVAVVYDVAPEPIRRIHKHRVKVQANPNIRQQRNKYTDTEGTSTEKTENKQLAKERNINENIKSGIFPKRTEGPNPFVPIIQSENYVFSHSGDFHYSYEGGDGTKASERGALKADKAGEAVEGSFSYIGNDGKDYSLTYTADENGYRPVGAHLPTPPPIPPAIARALKYLATKPTPETITESYY